MADYRVADQIVWPHDGELTTKANERIAGMEESSLIPTDAITLTNEDAMDSARTALPTGGIPDQFTELLIAERQGEFLQKKSGTRRTTEVRERSAHLRRLQQDNDATPHDFKPISKQNSGMYKN